MAGLDKKGFLGEVLSYIRFPFDREEIRIELESHIEERIGDYRREGYDQQTAEKLAVDGMGNAKEIGVELNKQHNPLLGWLWWGTNMMIFLMGTWIVLIVIVPALISFLDGRSFDEIPKPSIVYTVDINESVQIDDRVIRFSKVIYDKEENLHIFYETYDIRLWGAGWSFDNIGMITDDLGNIYATGSGGAIGGFKSKGRRTVRNFSQEASIVIITYDQFNRKYQVKVPLKAGDQNQ